MSLEHCIDKVTEIIARGRDDRRSLFQLGYNLGRLSELTGQGRAPFWDQWKEPVECWDLERLTALAHGLQTLRGNPT